MISKQDLREYSDQELSLIVFNTESLYDLRRTRYFIDALNDEFIYTDEQLAVLKQDLEDDESGE